MDSMHDLGGKQGFGAVVHRRDAPVFHAPWEVRANALYSLAVKCGVFNMDEYRHAIERMTPQHYLLASYYERSLTSLATLCVEKGLVTHEELAHLAGGVFPLAMPSAPGRSNHTDRSVFVPGEPVRVRNEHVAGHVRLPGYIRGKRGVVISQSPPYPFPDAHAHGVAADDEPTYDVRFEATDLWPQGGEPAQVHVAVFESYLEPLSGA
jgi:nitrile hydratase subunit beta